MYYFMCFGGLVDTPFTTIEKNRGEKWLNCTNPLTKSCIVLAQPCDRIESKKKLWYDSNAIVISYSFFRPKSSLVGLPLIYRIWAHSKEVVRNPVSDDFC